MAKQFLDSIGLTKLWDKICTTFPSKTGVGATGTWGINISGYAGRVDKSISFKNTSGTKVSFNGSTEVDLTSGVNYAATATTATNADKLKIYNVANINSSRVPVCGTTVTQSNGYGDICQIPNTYYNAVDNSFTIGCNTYIDSDLFVKSLEVNGEYLLSTCNITCTGSITADKGFIGNITGNCSGSAGHATTSTTATNSNNVKVNVSSTSDGLPLLLTTWGNGTAANKAIYMDSTKSLYYVPSTNTLYSGVIQASDTMNATNGFFETSDERLKDIVKPVKVDLERLSKLRKVYFTWKDNKTNKHLGMIAQDVKELYPELITEQNGQLSLAYDKLSVIALEAIDILYKENKELKEQLNNLENKCFYLEEKLIDLEVLIKKLVKNNK